MKWLEKATSNEQVELDAPASPSLMLFRILFVGFLFSFVFDYKSPDLGFGDAATGGSIFQYAFLGLAMLTGGLATVLGAKGLLVRPGVYMVLFWWGYVVMALAVAFFWGNETGRILRLAIPLILVGFAINTTLIVAANGMRPGEVVRWFLFAGLVNVTWRFFFGALFSGIPLSSIRMEVLSPSMRFLFAWVGCAFLLRRKFTWWSLVIFGLPLAVAAISITRSMALPIVVSFITAGFCLVLAMMWKMYDLSFPLKKIGPLIAMGFAMIFVIVGVALAQPNLVDRWTQRLTDNKGESGAVTEDLSTLMRKAEAKSMWDILAKEPHSFIYGRGLGASYYWDESYFPELFLVYPADRHQFPDEIYSAGHSIWTYTLFSTGWIGVGFTLFAFFIPMGMSLHSAYLNSKTVMGPRAWDSFLIFLPFVAMWATLSESITRNPFDERFTGVLFGFMIALPQFFYNRAVYLRYREAAGEASTQIVIDEDILDDLMADDDAMQPGRTRPPAGSGHHLVGCSYEFREPPGEPPARNPMG
ncbi:hypothetical protein VSU19_21080 [Verrucomicrobiales bacterium BCK34]|nr:hypothetical protein [Verrucomicrobiales bacterium BCK34]